MKRWNKILNKGVKNFGLEKLVKFWEIGGVENYNLIKGLFKRDRKELKEMKRLKLLSKQLKWMI